MVGRQPPDEQYYAALLATLAEQGEVEEDRERGVLTILAHEDQALAVPRHLHVTPRALSDHLREGEAPASAAFPDVDAATASWRLFLGHLDRAIRTAKDGQTELVLDEGVVRARRP